MSKYEHRREMRYTLEWVRTISAVTVLLLTIYNTIQYTMTTILSTIIVTLALIGLLSNFSLYLLYGGKRQTE